MGGDSRKPTVTRWQSGARFTFAGAWMILMVTLLLAGSHAVQADGTPRFEVVSTFSRSIEHPRRNSLVEVADGTGFPKIYGTASEGGMYNCGAIYGNIPVPTPVLHFTGRTGAAKGAAPQGTLLVEGSVIWGTTEKGGLNDAGTVYKYNLTTGELTTVLEFGQFAMADAGYVGRAPTVGLTRDGNGMLWGVSAFSSLVMVFKIDPATGVVTPITSLTSSTGAQLGELTRGELTFDGVDSLWGVTSNGGPGGFGRIYKIHQQTHVITVVATLTGASGAAPAKSPTGSLVHDGNGNLLGLSSPQVIGSSAGQVFSVNISTGEFSVLGTLPRAENLTLVTEGLVPAGDGYYAGISHSNTSKGSVFFWRPDSPNFALTKPFLSPVNTGSYPMALLRMEGGWLVCATYNGGAYNKGCLSSVSPSGISTFRSFGDSNDLELSAGSVPAGGLVESTADGALWGMTQQGGSRGGGTVYSLKPGGDTMQVRGEFGTVNTGITPVGELVRHLKDGSGNDYWWGMTTDTTTAYPFASSRIFRVTDKVGGAPENFINMGPIPDAGLAVGANNHLWTAADTGIYRIDPTVAWPTPYKAFSFTGTTGDVPGTYPSAGLLNVGDGYMWGTTKSGGASDYGVVYSVSPDPGGTYVPVVQFTGVGGSAPGAYPYPKLVVGSPGYVWGVTGQGGTANYGTVFKINTATGALTTVVNFDNIAGSIDTGLPYAGLTADGRGYLWGITSQGQSRLGSIYRINIATGAFQSMFEFTGDTGTTTGSKPVGSLVLHSDGNLYGATKGLARAKNGAPVGGGNIYRIRFGKALEVKANPMTYPVDGRPISDVPSQGPRTVYDFEDSFTRTLTVSNPGNQAITAFSAVFSGTNPEDYTLAEPLPTVLEPGQIATVKVKFAPKGLGSRQAVLTLGADSPDTDPFVIKLADVGAERVATISATVPLWEGDRPHAVPVRIAKAMPVPVKVYFSVTRGVASTADFSISASPVVIPAGSTVGYIIVTPKQDLVRESSEDFTVKLTRTSHAAVKLSEQTSTKVFHILDDDELPEIGTGVGGLFAVGQVLNLNSKMTNPTGLPFTGKWTRDGKVIPGATQPIYTVPVATLAHAGMYQFSIKADGGSLFTGNAFPVWVVDARLRTLTVAQNTHPSLPAVVAGPPGMTFEWYRMVEGEPVKVNDGLRHLQTNTETLIIEFVQLADTGRYELWCMMNGVAVSKSAFDLIVFNTAPGAATPVFPATMVGRPYSYQLPHGGGHTATPSKYVASGLPPGLVCDAGSGLITGQATKTGRYKVTVTLSNSLGKVTTSAYLEVTKLPESLLGSFVGLSINTGYSSIGSRLDFTTTSNGRFSGYVLSGVERRKFSGEMTLQEDGSAVSEIDVIAAANSPMPYLKMLLTIKPDGTFTGTFDTPNLPGGGAIGVLNITGWRNVWSTTGNPAVAAYHTYSLPETDHSGTGYGSLTVGRNGTTTMSGRLADDSAFACTATLGPDSSFLLYQSLYPERGGVRLMAKVNAPVTLGGLATINMADAGTWVTPPKTALTRYFQEGYRSELLHTLDIVGGAWRKPDAGSNLLGAPVVAVGQTNLTLTFLASPFFDVGLSQSPPQVAFRVATDHKAKLPAAGSASNAARVTLTTFSPTTGFFAGTFVLDRGTVNERSATFKGTMVTGEGKGHGYFILPQPADALAVPPTTVKTSPMQAGTVVMEPQTSAP